MKRRLLLILAESQTREACEAREYYITYAKRTARKPVRGIQIVGTAQRKLSRRQGGDVRERERERGNLSRFLSSSIFSIRSRICATLRCLNAWRCLAVRIFSVSTLSHSPFSLGSDLSFDCLRVLD